MSRLARSAVFIVAYLTVAWASAQEARVLDLEGGERIEYALRAFPAEAHLLDPAADLAPTDALSTAKLLTRYLAGGRIEEASLLSNAPKARHDRLRESLAGWTAADFERAYGRYFATGNRIVGEAVIGSHRLLMWYLKDVDHLAAFYFVEVDGKLLLDDVPNEARAKLRRVLEAFRSGRAS